MLAEVTAREVGRIDLSEALELTALVASKDRPRSRRMAARWLQRYLETQAVAIEDAAHAAGALAALGGPMHDDALVSLRGMTERATRPPEPTVVHWEPT